MGKYDDIINLPHHESKNHPRMSNSNRAAQFAPFAALVGFEDAIKNSEEKLNKKKVLSEERKEEIEAVLQKILHQKSPINEFEVTYFIYKDKKEELGKYVSYKGKIKKIDFIEEKLIFVNKKTIDIKSIYNIKEIPNE